VSVLRIDPMALADAKSTIVVWSACLYRQLAVYYEKFVGDFAVGMPRNLPWREREEAYPNIASGHNGFRILYG
jgi:hypothetical protein